MPTASKGALTDLTIAHVVHDVRNHLTVIMRCAEHVWPLVPAEAKRDLTTLQQSAERASLLAREVLTGARSSSAARTTTDVNDVVSRVVHSLSGFTTPRIRLRLNLSPEPVLVAAAFEEVERILLNLALNACDAMGGDGVLTIRTAAVDVRARLTVKDTGCGLTPDVQRRMFEPFFSTKPAGMGLGLSSVAFTVRRLHGTVSVVSLPGRGTSVCVVLPRVPQHRP
jgi:signal transduction histidine kinase